MSKKKKEIIIIVIISLLGIINFFLIKREEVRKFVKLNYLFKAKKVKKASKKAGYIKVRISGMIRHPGTYLIKEGLKLSSLIQIAGGLKRYASIYLPYKLVLKDSEEYYIPYRKLKKGEYININTADELELCTIPYITKNIAKEILLYREKYGKFDSKEELKEINGIGEKKYNIIKNFVEIGE